MKHLQYVAQHHSSVGGFLLVFLRPVCLFLLLLLPNLSIIITVVVIIHLTSMTCVISPKLISSCLYLSIYPSDSPSIRPVCLVIYQAHFPFVLSQPLRFSQKSGHDSYSAAQKSLDTSLLRCAVMYWVRVRSPSLVLQRSLILVASDISSVA